MRIGGFLLIKNEEDCIADLLTYYLDHEQFDELLVMDNGSTDRTVEIVRSFDDPRLHFTSTPRSRGYVQNVLSTELAMDLFKVYNCNWVIPIDADEYWVSRKHGSVRNALKQFNRKVDGIYAKTYNFFNTEYDNPSIKNAFVRLTYARYSSTEKVILHNLEDKLKLLKFGNHGLRTVDESKAKLILINPEVLVRFHYPYRDIESTLRKVMSQAEGFILATGGEWLTGKLPIGTHIFEWYQAIKENRFHDLWMERQFYSKEKVDTLLKTENFSQLTHVSDIMRGLINKTSNSITVSR